MLLLLDIDGTLCPIGPGPDVAMRHLSIGTGAVSFRADLPEVLAELAACYELAWATAWEDNANLLLAPALGLPALPVVRFAHPAPDVGSRYAAVPGSCRASSASRPISHWPGSTTTFTATRTRGRRCGGFRPSCSRRTRAAGSSTGTSARCWRLRAAMSAGGRRPAERFARSIPACGTLNAPPLAGAAIVCLLSLSVALIEAPRAPHRRSPPIRIVLRGFLRGLPSDSDKSRRGFGPSALS